MDGGAESTALPEVVLDAFAAAFFLLPFLGGMENENGPRCLFPEIEIAQLNRGSPFSPRTLTLLSHYHFRRQCSCFVPASRRACYTLTSVGASTSAWRAAFAARINMRAAEHLRASV